MKHTDIRMFLNRYLPRRIGVDMQALMGGLDPDSELMRAVTRMGRWMDPGQPRELTDEQKVSMEGNPELIKAIEKRDSLALELQSQSKKNEDQLAKLERLKKAVTNTRNRFLYALRICIRRDCDDEQAVIDIEQQLAGTAVHDTETKERLQQKDQMPPELVVLNEKLMTWPTSHSIEAEWRRQNEPVEAVRVYCDVLEGGPPRGRRPQAVNYVEEDVVMEDALMLSVTALFERDRSFWAAEEHIRTGVLVIARLAEVPVIELKGRTLTRVLVDPTNFRRGRRWRTGTIVKASDDGEEEIDRERACVEVGEERGSIKDKK